MDIKPPQNWRPPQPQRVEVTPEVLPKPVPALPVGEVQLDLPETVVKIRKKRGSKVRRIVIVIFTMLLVAGGGVFGWYVWAISPVSGDTTQQAFVIGDGDRLSTIGQYLEKQGLIRSAVAFEVCARLTQGSTSTLKAGAYKLAPNQSVSDMVAVFIKGQDGVRNVLIPPGLTLKQLADPTVKGSFVSQGFSESEVKAAFSAHYDSLLLKDKPAGASLEGYIFPETFQVKTEDSLKSVLERSFDELYSKLVADGYVKKFTDEGLSIHEALTLGSIVQEETSDAAMQPQIAQVFLLRLKIGMSLGSDVTYIYAARQLGVTPTPELDSPYNTRIHTGLPPGPIATMNYSALQAVALPATGDYLFFVAGDDGNVYFSRSNEEHEQQVQQYCKTLCSATL